MKKRYSIFIVLIFIVFFLSYKIYSNFLELSIIHIEKTKSTEYKIIYSFLPLIKLILLKSIYNIKIIPEKINFITENMFNKEKITNFIACYNLKDYLNYIINNNQITIPIISKNDENNIIFLDSLKYFLSFYPENDLNKDYDLFFLFEKNFLNEILKLEKLISNYFLEDVINNIMINSDEFDKFINNFIILPEKILIIFSPNYLYNNMLNTNSFSYVYNDFKFFGKDNNQELKFQKIMVITHPYDDYLIFYTFAHELFHYCQSFYEGEILQNFYYNNKDIEFLNLLEKFKLKFSRYFDKSFTKDNYYYFYFGSSYDSNFDYFLPAKEALAEIFSQYLTFKFKPTEYQLIKKNKSNYAENASYINYYVRIYDFMVKYKIIELLDNFLINHKVKDKKDKVELWYIILNEYLKYCVNDEDYYSYNKK